MPDGNWTEWSQFVLKELERLNRCYESLDGRIAKVHDSVTILNVKASLLGGVSGLAVAMVLKFIGN